MALVTALPLGGVDLSAQTIELTLETMLAGVSVGTPAFSPDGEAIALTSNRSGRTKVWIMDQTGEGARLLLADEDSESAPTWSPDGRSIAVLRRSGGQSDIWLADGRGVSLRRLTNDAGGERALAWSPDGGSIAFMSDRAGHQDVYAVDVASGSVSKLTEGAMPWDELRFGVAWSPDSRKIAYVSNASGEWADDLWWVDVASGDREKLTADVHVMTTPVWSPDGSRIAFNALAVEEFWYGDQSDIYTVEPDTRSVSRVDMNAHVADGNGGIRLAWSPDSERIYFRSLWQGDANLWTVPAGGGVATQITYEVGSFGNFSVAGDGSAVAYTRSTPTRGGAVHRVDLDGGAPVQITSWGSRFEGLGVPTRVSFRSTDGTYILGYLYTPPSFDPSGQYPSLVQVHGGGNNAYGNGFHALEHLLALEGFVVLAIEYRGSAGHGRAFQDLALGEWAAGQGWDAVAAARFLESQPYSNGSVGIYGGSYGGIMSLAALTRDSDPFDAAAPFRGIYDWEDAYEHGDRLMRFWIIEGHLGFAPGEHPELFEHTASLRHLDRVKPDLPFLVAHGERDRRAPFQQSERLVDALRRRGNPVEFLTYPEDGHGLSAASRLEAWGRMITFFREHLGGVPRAD